MVNKVMPIKANSKPPDIEQRNYRMEMRATKNGETRLVGYAAVFNSETRLFGSVWEVIEPGAFAKTLKEGDARAFWNHNSDLVLGRVSNGTLKLSEDKKGLRTEIIPPGTDYIRDVAIAPIERGDVSEMSLGFRVVKYGIEERDTDAERKIVYRLKEVELFEVSPVAMPAYSDTDISARSREHIEEFMQQRQAAPTPEGAAKDESTKPQEQHSVTTEPYSTHLDERAWTHLEMGKRGIIPRPSAA